MTESAEVVIVGAGIVGASIAFHLAARGVTDVLLLEKADREVTGTRMEKGRRRSYFLAHSSRTVGWKQV